MKNLFRTLVLLAFLCIGTNIFADGITFTYNKPWDGQGVKPGEIIPVEWSYHNPGEYKLTFTYPTVNGGTSTVIVYEGSSRSISYKIPCDAATVLDANGDYNATFNVVNKPGTFNHTAYGSRGVKIVDGDPNKPPLIADGSIPAFNCDNSEFEVCISDQRIRHLNTPNPPTWGPEERYIRWYKISSALAIQLTPEDILERIANGALGPPFAEGYGKRCVWGSQMGNAEVLVVIATKVYSPECTLEQGRTSLPTLIPVIKVPELESLLDLSTQEHIVFSDEGLPCDPLFRCYIRGTYYKLPSSDEIKTLIEAAYDVPGNTKLNKVTADWVYEPSGLKQHMTQYITATGETAYKICYSDLNGIVKGKYKCTVAMEFMIEGKVKKCSQSFSITVTQDPTPVSNAAVTQLKALYAILEDLFPPTGPNPCQLMALLKEFGFFDILQRNANPENPVLCPGSPDFVFNDRAEFKKVIPELGITMEELLNMIYDFKWESTGEIENPNTLQLKVDYSMLSNTNAPVSYILKAKLKTESEDRYEVIYEARASKSPLCKNIAEQAEDVVPNAELAISQAAEELQIPGTQQPTKGLSELTNLYPNPTKNDITIEYIIKNAASARLLVFDLMGKTMYIEDLNTADRQTTINLSHLSAGTYFCILETDGIKTGYRKIIKIKE